MNPPSVQTRLEALHATVKVDSMGMDILVVMSTNAKVALLTAVMMPFVSTIQAGLIVHALLDTTVLVVINASQKICAPTIHVRRGRNVPIRLESLSVPARLENMELQLLDVTISTSVWMAVPDVTSLPLALIRTKGMNVIVTRVIKATGTLARMWMSVLPGVINAIAIPNVRIVMADTIAHANQEMLNKTLIFSTWWGLERLCIRICSV